MARAHVSLMFPSLPHRKHCFHYQFFQDGNMLTLHGREFQRKSEHASVAKILRALVLISFLRAIWANAKFCEHFHNLFFYFIPCHLTLSRVYIINFKLRKLRYINFIWKFLDNPLNYFRLELSPLVLWFQRREERRKKPLRSSWSTGPTGKVRTQQSFTFSRAPTWAPFICRSGGGSISLAEAGVKN